MVGQFLNRQGLLVTAEHRGVIRSDGVGVGLVGGIIL